MLTSLASFNSAPVPLQPAVVPTPLVNAQPQQAVHAGAMPLAAAGHGAAPPHFAPSYDAPTQLSQAFSGGVSQLSDVASVNMFFDRSQSSFADG